MFRGERKKKERISWHLGLGWRHDDRVQKKSIIFSSRTVSLVCLSKCASRWNCFATFRHRWKLIRRSNRHGISALRCPVPCKRTPQVLSNRPEFGITLSRLSDRFFRWTSTALLSRPCTHHWLFWKELIKIRGTNTVFRNGFNIIIIIICGIGSSYCAC